jgi:hypothetical protein
MPVEENKEQSPPDSGKGSPPSSHGQGEATRLGTKEDSRGADARKEERPPEKRDNLRDGT